MKTKVFKELELGFLRKRDSECKRDYKKHHYWEKIGFTNPSFAFLVWRCSQCKKIVYEPLEELVLDEWGKVIE